jgi:hypothetical protein
MGCGGKPYSEALDNARIVVSLQRQLDKVFDPFSYLLVKDVKEQKVIFKNGELLHTIVFACPCYLADGKNSYTKNNIVAEIAAETVTIKTLAGARSLVSMEQATLK